MEQVVVATLINMLVLSCIYILVALGFAFLFNIIGILNLAHGAIYMIGGYIGFVFAMILGLNKWVALLLSTIVVALFGVFLERFCFRPFAGNFNRIIMVCVAITVILQTAVNIIVGTKTLALPAFVEGVLRAGSISVSYQRIVTFTIGVGLLGAIVWFVNRTKWGKQMQAISQDREGAYLQGIRVHDVSAVASALGCGLAAIAGCLMGAYLGLGPFMGDLMLVKALILTILAGAGSISGIFITGIVLGTLDAVIPMWIVGAGSDAIVVSIVVVLLLIRPKGFFGHEA